MKVTTTTTRDKDKNRDYETKNVQFKLYSKLTALEQLGKHLGFFEKDNEQRRQLTIVDIMAIVGVKNGNGNSRTHSGS